MIRLLGILLIMGWGAGCGDPLNWMDSAGCCITDEERAVCGDVTDDYVEELKEVIRRRDWDTEEDALLFENSDASSIEIDYGYGDRSVDANCLAGLIRLEISTEGLYRKHYPNGKVEYEVNYVDGKREGKFVRNYRSGQVYEEGNYKDGQQDGKWVYYDRKENIIDEDIWKNGKCIEMCEENDEDIWTGWCGDDTPGC